MDDETLRSELAAWLAPAERIPVPDSSRLKRRARRRLAGQASASALAGACVVASAGLIFGLPGSPVPPHVQVGAHVSACASHDLAARWLPPAPVRGAYMEPPPRTYLLALRDTGPVSCSLYGWPRLVLPGPERPASVSIFYRTHLPEMVFSSISRVVKPTRLVLEPGASAVSAVTVDLPPLLRVPCFTRAWPVKPPGAGATAIRSHGSRLEVCPYTAIYVSPLYPPSVPITKNYPGRSYATSSSIPGQPTISATITATATATPRS